MHSMATCSELLQSGNHKMLIIECMYRVDYSAKYRTEDTIQIQRQSGVK